jgi:hypothetical protein
MDSFQARWEEHYERAVRAATQAAYSQKAGYPLDQVYMALADELRQRGIEPEPDAVFEGARLISAHRKPRVLRD